MRGKFYLVFPFKILVDAQHRLRFLPHSEQKFHALAQSGILKQLHKILNRKTYFCEHRII